MDRTVDFLIMVLYFVVTVYIGWVVSRRVKAKGLSEFYVSSKSMSMFPMVMTVIGTHIGSGLTLGMIGKIYNLGFQAVWIGFAWFLGSILWTLLLAKRARRMANKEGWGYTMGDVFEDRMGKPGRFLFGLVATWERAAVTGGQLVAQGVMLAVLGSAFGISTTSGIIIAGVVLVFYVMYGGLTAVIWTDVMQTVLELGGIAIIIPIVLTMRVGFDAIFSVTQPGFYDIIPTNIPLIATIAAWFTGVLGNQNLWQKSVACKDEKTALWSNLLGSIVGLAWGFMMVYIAFAMKTAFPDIKTNPDAMLLNTIMDTFPIIITGLIFAGLVAGIMNTASSVLLNGVMNLSHDLYYKTFNRNASEAKVLRFSRIVTPFIAFVPVALATWMPQIIEVQNLGYGMYGPSVSATFIAAMFWKKMTPKGGVAGMIAGLVVGVTWYLEKWGPVPYSVAGAFASLITLWVVSLATQPKGIVASSGIA